MSRILIAEDEERIASFVEKGLVAAGFATVVVRTGTDALDYALTGGFDLLILDIGLPGLDGYEVLRQLRADGSELPVIVRTARDSAADTLASLEGGANDYMSKPFRFDELLARVRLRMAEAPRETTTVFSVDGLQLDLRTRRATLGNRQVDLSACEFALAEEFLQPGLGLLLGPRVEHRRRLCGIPAGRIRCGTH